MEGGGTFNNSYPQAARNFVYYGEAVIEPCIFAIGTITNIASLLILPKTHIVMTLKVCLIGMAASDLGATLFGFIQMLVEVVFFDGDVPFGIWNPRAVLSFTLYFVYATFMSSSAAMVSTIAILRCVIIVRPMSGRYFTPRRARWMCIGVFLCTLALFTITTLNIIWQSCYISYKNKTMPEDHICKKTFRKVPNLEDTSNSYFYALIFIYGPVPVVVNIICFFAIRSALSKNRKMMLLLGMRKSQSSPAETPQERSATKTTKTLLRILILDTICTIPAVLQAFGLIVAPDHLIFNKDHWEFSVFDVIAEICLCLRPGYNFWLYVYSHRSFRRRLCKIFCRNRYELNRQHRNYSSASETTQRIKKQPSPAMTAVRLVQTKNNGVQDTSSAESETFL